MNECKSVSRSRVLMVRKSVFSRSFYDRPSFSSWPHLHRSFLLLPENVVFLPSTGFFGFHGKLIPIAARKRIFWSHKPRGRAYLRTSAALAALFISRGRLKTRSRCLFSPRNFFSTFSTYLVSSQPYIRQKKTSYMTQIYTTHSQQCAFWR